MMKKPALEKKIAQKLKGLYYNPDAEPLRVPQNFIELWNNKYDEHWDRFA